MSYKQIFKNMVFERCFNNGTSFDEEKAELIMEFQQIFEES